MFAYTVYIHKNIIRKIIHVLQYVYVYIYQKSTQKVLKIKYTKKKKITFSFFKNIFFYILFVYLIKFSLTNILLIDLYVDKRTTSSIYCCLFLIHICLYWMIILSNSYYLKKLLNSFYKKCPHYSQLN